MQKSEQSAFIKNNDKDEMEKILITIPSEIKYIRKVSSEILDKLMSYRLDEDGVFDIRLCVEEAVRNAILHGNKSDKKKKVRISYWVEDGKINVEIEDGGNGFDPAHLPDPTTDDNIMKNSGRGVYLIKKIMDDVEFNDVGNKIRMTKCLE